jgi:hypothetical protein
MKESITKFDLEAAFKALDEIDVPVTKGIKANKPALTEIFSRKTKFDSLMEEYYNVSDMTELDDAKEAREAEVAKAKLARIEKIVDLDAESPEDLLTSYVGKYIMQCPQCMTLFYKNPEDIEESEEDPAVVNVNEVCQHCGNESGYTLVGKVGEATPEEAAEYNDEEAVDVTSTEDSQENAEVSSNEDAEGSDEDLDLDVELDELDLDIEEDEPAEELENEEPDKKEESHFIAHSGETLVEELTEEANLDVSADEFEKLISSPEFKKPISDSSVRAMMNDEADEAKEDDNLDESITINNETLRYAVINPDGTYAGVPCTSYEEARELVAGKDGRVMVELGEPIELNELEEGIFDKIKDRLARIIDKIARKLKSREAKADWILTNAMKDYGDVKVTDDGEVSADAANRRFSTFVIIGFKGIDADGKEITKLTDSRRLVTGMKYPELATTYEKADDIAKGWSMRSGNGPAFIYLAKSKNDEKAVILCEYLNGKLVLDKTEEIFNKVKDDLAGAKLMTRGGADQSDVKKIKASELKQGMSIKLKDDSVGEVVEIGESKLSSAVSITIKLADGTTETLNIGADSALAVFKTSIANESLELSSVMNCVEELQENALESLISDSLVESYGNVAGFRLTECAYTDNKFTVDGTIYFTSGNTRKTTYTFSEAYTAKDGKISIQGLNEKLGLDKQFTITGYANSNKVFITESFKRSYK